MTQLFLGVDRTQSSTTVLVGSTERRGGPCNHADEAKFRDAIGERALIGKLITMELLRLTTSLEGERNDATISWR